MPTAPIFRSCYLHIGTEKTGTTSIQSFLAGNRRALCELGFYYPEAFGLPSQIGLTLYARSPDVVDDLPRRRGLTGPRQIEAHRTALLEAFLREVAPLEGRGLTLLLSNEHLHSRLEKRDAIARLHDLLHQVAAEVQVIVYVRRQDQLAVSLESTRMKLGGAAGKKIFPPSGDVLPAYFNYEALLARYGTVFGRPNCIVRPFRREHLIGGDVLQDFAGRIGLPLGPGLARPTRRNESVSLFGHQLLAELNRIVPPFVGDRVNRLRGNLGDTVEKLYPGKPPLASRQDAMEFQARFAESNRAVKREYLPDLSGIELFDGDFTMYPEVLGAESPSFVKACQAAAELWTSQMRRILHLREGNTTKETALAIVHKELLALALALPQHAEPATVQHVALALLAADAPSEALGLSERALAASHEDAELLCISGICLAKLGERARAEDRFRAALAARPDHAEASRHLMRMREQKQPAGCARIASSQCVQTL